MKLLILTLALASQLLGAYGYNSVLTVDRTKVPNTNQTNFPMMVSGTYDGTGGEPDLRVTGSGGKVTDTQGDDIVFGTNSTCSSLLNWEIERYTSTTGVIIAWIKIPTLTTASDYVFYMCYGDAGVTTFQGNVTGTWDSNYIYVGHTPDGTSLTVLDSTSNANNGTVTGGVVAIVGKIGGAADFNGTTGYVTAGGSYAPAELLTCEAWVNADAFTGDPVIMGADATDRPYVELLASGKIAVGAALLNNPSISTPALSTGTWYHVVAVMNTTSTPPKIYLNGAEVAYDQVGGGGAVQPFTGLQFGSFHNASLFFDGKLDEVRYSNVNRSADWIATEYNNQNSPLTFYSVGAETVSAVGIKRRVIQ